nr:hypothetical protein [Micromonospora sp. DSM 115978]
AAWEGDLAVQLRSADLARPQMEALADDLGVECVASAIAGEEIVLVANAGGHRSPLLPTQVGQRIPFLPPVGTVFAAWAPEAARAAWLGRVGPDARDALEATLAAVCRAGYSVGRGDGWHHEFRAALTKADPDDPTDATHEAVRDLIRALPPSYESPEVAAADDGSIRTLSAPVFGRDGTVLLVLSAVNSSSGPLAR